MRLAVVSHKVCWSSDKLPGTYQTDGGFSLQVKALSELFDETMVLIPCEKKDQTDGVLPLRGKNLRIQPLPVLKGRGGIRKLGFPLWLVKNGRTIWKEISRADAIHTPIPGDVGTIGMLFAMLQRKPLFVRHCGNWLVQRTTAEQFWKWSMERFAGGRNVMFATGGTKTAPSERNPHIKWIFSTSLTNIDIKESTIRQFPKNGRLKLISACRLEERKGVDVVLKSMPVILKKYPKATLDIVGDGSLMNDLKEIAEKLKIKERVKFHGKVKQTEVIKLMKQAHVFCFPTTASEGFPKVVIEALACGLPVITTKVSGLPKLIGQGGGILLEKAMDKAVAEAVLDICADNKRYRQFSSKAINTAQQYTLENWRDVIGENLRQAWNVESLSSTG